MRRAVLMMLLLAGAAFASNCVPGSMAFYAANPCDFGIFHYKGFSFTSYSGNPVGANPTPAEVFVSLPMDGDLAMGFTSSKFTIGPLQYAAYRIAYTIDPPPDIIDGFDTTMDASSPTNGGKADIWTNLCIGGTFGGYTGSGPPTCGTTTGPGTTATLHAFYYATGNPLDIKLTDSLVFPGVKVLDVEHYIYLNTLGDPDATSQINGVLGAVPEPSAALLLGTVVAALAALRTRRKRR